MSVKQHQKIRNLVCPYCKAHFKACRNDAVYCSGKCRIASWRIVNAGKIKQNPASLTTKETQTVIALTMLGMMLQTVGFPVVKRIKRPSSAVASKTRDRG